MFESSVITNSGNALLASWVGGAVLSFDGAKSGTGTVPPTALVNQTGLVNQKQELSIIGVEKVASGVRVKVRISAAAAAYQLNQIGIWGNINGGPSTLIALYQDSTGFPVPSVNTNPDFAFTFYGLIQASNTGVLNVTIDTSALAALSDITDENLLITDVTTNNASTSKHGFAPKATAPAAGQRNVLAIDNGESGYKNAALFDSTNPAMNGTASPGTALTAARRDHVHPSDTSKLSVSLKGAPNGLAELDASGRVPVSQLPSYVDDVVEYNNMEAFPSTGETGKIYIALDTNKTYRWSGSGYVEISQSLALGETESTAYRGDRGKVAYDHSQISGNPHGTTAAQVGAAALSTVVSATLNAASWTGSSVPFSYVYNNANITATNIVELLPGADITAEQLEALQKANIAKELAQSNGSITFGAFGEKPTINIPVRLVFRGDT